MAQDNNEIKKEVDLKFSAFRAQRKDLIHEFKDVIRDAKIEKIRQAISGK